MVLPQTSPNCTLITLYFKFFTPSIIDKLTDGILRIYKHGREASGESCRQTETDEADGTAPRCDDPNGARYERKQ